MLASAAEVAGTAVSFASFLTMAAAMALGIEMEKKRKAAQMSATAVSFFLDREGHKKFLRAATNQELEAENKRLREELADKTEECGYWYTEAKSYERSYDIQCNILEQVNEDLYKIKKLNKKMNAEEHAKSLGRQ